jgi:metal-dependent amidase/aminoacylase/carboxypeptidase family protein
MKGTKWWLLSGCFFFVGARLPGELRPHHKAVFDFDEVFDC